MSEATEKNHAEAGPRSDAAGEKPAPARSGATRSQKRRAVVRWVKRGVLLVLGGGFLAALVLAFLPRPVPVDVAAATIGAMRVTVDEDGKTRVKDRYVVIAPLTGNMTRLGGLPGDAVSEGDQVTSIVPALAPLLDARTRAETQARLAQAQAIRLQAQAQVERARAAHAQAEREAERDARLVASKAVPESVAERSAYQAKALGEELRSAEFGVKVATQEVASARAALGLIAKPGQASEPRLLVTAPVSGKILRVFRQDEGLVPAGTQLVELGDPTSLEVVADVLTRDAVEIRAGAPVDIVRWGGEDTLSGRVVRVEPSAFTRVSALGVEEQRVNVLISIDEPHERWAALGDGYRVEVAIEVWRGDSVLMVPGSAVFRHGQRFAVYRIDGGKAALTAIEVGRRNEDSVAVTAGLTAGARVILHPSDRVQDGVDVSER